MKYNRILSACAAVAITTGSFALVSSPVSAKDGPVLVVADEDTITRRISYADLNLASASGEVTLNRRVGGGIRSLCLEATAGSDLFGIDHQCRNFAWSQARPQIAEATQRAHDIALTGTSTIAASSITIAFSK